MQRVEHCLLCGSAQSKILELETQIARIPSPGSIVECTQCGLRFVSPRPTRDKVRDIYKQSEDIYRSAGIEYIGGETQVAEYLRKRLKYLQVLIGRRGTLLDVGAGSGAFLKFAKDEGWEVMGTELLEDIAASIQQKYGINVVVGDLTELTLPDAAFDVIHMNHVLEHVIDPISNLKHAKRLLKPGGILALEVPWEFADLVFISKRILGIRSYYPVPSQHLQFFNPRTITRMIRTNGFEVVSLSLRRECNDRLKIKRFIKHAVYCLEYLVRRAPIIVVIAQRPHIRGGSH